MAADGEASRVKGGVTGAALEGLGRAAGGVLGWAVFLACSWTWCIGMFLPALLVRDFGAAGFWVFAIPNVVGAAAMGFVLRRDGGFGRMREGHTPALQLFSLVTFLFHVVFITLVVVPFAKSVLGVSPALPALLLVFVFALAGGVRSAAAVYVVSLVAGGVWLSGSVSIPIDAEAAAGYAASRLPADHLAGLIAVCVLGFVGCPYLDATFWRAREALPAKRARWAFALGFVVFFGSMIAFTRVYAPVFTPTYAEGAAKPADRAVLWLVAHLVVQAAFTMGVHLKYLMQPSPGMKKASVWATVAVGVLFVSFAMQEIGPPGTVKPAPGLWLGAGDGLGWYRVFLGAYGLAFPAYLWLCVLPNRSLTIKPTLRQVRVLIGALAGAGPMFYVAFVERETLWAVGGVGVVMLARAFVRPGAAPERPSDGPAGVDRDQPPALRLVGGDGPEDPPLRLSR